ncbi:MAG: hypothetical protein ACRDBM_11050, partial [Sporomusa sp.]
AMLVIVADEGVMPRQESIWLCLNYMVSHMASSSSIKSMMKRALKRFFQFGWVVGSWLFMAAGSKT